MESTGAESFPDWTIDGVEVARRLGAAGLDVDGVRPVYLRDKPGETLVVGYEFTQGSHVERGYLRWCADAERAADDLHKANAMGPTPSSLGPGVVGIDELATVRILPNDARLRRARWYLTPRKLKRTLGDLDVPDGLGTGRTLSGSATSVRVLTYKPERRIVARIDLGYSDGHRRSVLLRYATRATAPRLASIAEHLHHHGVATARPIVQLERGTVGIDEFLDGIDLRTAAACADQRVIDAVADQVAALHRAPAPAGVDPRPRDRELAVALESLAWLGIRRFADRGLAAAVGRALVTASKRAAVAPAVLVHGDLHDRNVLVDVAASGGPAATMIDLERVAVGEAAIDLGRLLAAGIAGGILGRADSTELSVFARIVDGVIARDGRSGGDRSALAFHVAKELVAVALTAARHLETSSDPHLAERMLTAALDVLREPAWLADLGDVHRRTMPTTNEPIPAHQPPPTHPSPIGR
jgi:aminoglycoside phosphotransferase (APT) family kinase protein